MKKKKKLTNSIGDCQEFCYRRSLSFKDPFAQRETFACAL